MSEKERRQPHPREPAEGSKEDVDAPGAERPGDPANPGAAGGSRKGAEKRCAEHPQEPAEGGEDEAAPEADKPDAG